MPIPSCIQVFIFPHVLGSGGMFLIIHPSFTWSSQAVEPSWVFILHILSFSIGFMPSPSSGSHWNILVHSNHSLFHSVHVRYMFVLLVELCFVLGWSPVVTILSRTKVQGLLCLLNEWVVEIIRFYEKEWSSVVSSVLLCNGLLCHRVSGSLFCCVDIVIWCVSISFCL